MSALRTAAQQALEVLVRASSYYDTYAEIAALEAALAEPEYPLGQASTDVGVPVYVVKKAEPVQEPVAWVECDGELVWNNREAAIGRNLYTSPPQRPAEPVQEPVASIYITPNGAREFDDWRHDLPVGSNLLYTSPPQRKPLTEEELQEALVYTNLIDRDAIDDPDGYDEGSTLAQIDALHRKLTAAQGCNPHPKAPHGFLRNASHTEDRYVCECEAWDPWEAGYRAGMEAALRAQS